ncbi:MAG: hypothetical protein P4M02_00575 [Clostridia bacterium]|nr:hypothetical protein [Clostridia bacterium]
MPNSLFSGNTERRCSCCAHGRSFQGGDSILCRHRGIVEPGYCCGRFRYDPLRRVPHCAPKMPEYDKDEFKL